MTGETEKRVCPFATRAIVSPSKGEESKGGYACFNPLLAHINTPYISAPVSRPAKASMA